MFVFDDAAPEPGAVALAAVGWGIHPDATHLATSTEGRVNKQLDCHVKTLKAVRSGEASLHSHQELGYAELLSRPVQDVQTVVTGALRR